MAAYALGAAYALWVFFVAVMHLARVQPLPLACQVLGYPLAVLAWLLDVGINQTLGSVLLLDLPQEWTLSERLERLKGMHGWRGSAADYVLRYLLDPFDPSGGHRPR